MIIGLKWNLERGLDLSWGNIDTKCNIFLSLTGWEQLYFASITSIEGKYDVFKCSTFLLGEVYFVIDIWIFCLLHCYL